MKITYDNIVKWFDVYFDTFNNNQGNFDTVPAIAKYFLPDLEFWGYNALGKRPSNKEELLMTMIHPGLHEHLTPREYIVDLKKLIVVVQFQVQFKDEPSGKVWPAKQTSTHYHLVQDDKGELKIKKILYFMEHRPASEGDYKVLWAKYREQAVAEKNKKGK